MLSPNKTANRFSVSRICWRRESTEALTLYQLASDCDTPASLYRPAAISARMVSTFFCQLAAVSSEIFSCSSSMASV